VSTTLSQFEPSAPCSCRVCKGMCKRACWPTPQEAQALLDAGYADRLMLDAWIGGFDDSYEDVYIVCPSTPGYCGGLAPGLGDDFNWMDVFGDGALANGGCVMQKNGLCMLHDKGLKPIEGRVAHHSKDSDNLHEAVARTWDSDVGRAVVERFCSTNKVTLP